MGATPIKSFAELGGARPGLTPTDKRALPIRLDRLLAFIADYQERNDKATPTVDAMANEMGVTPQTIRHWIGVMEQQGMIHRYGQNPIRIMVKQGAKSLEAARRLDDIATGATQPTGWKGAIKELEKGNRFEEANARRWRLARYIGEFWTEHKRGPSIPEMEAYIGAGSKGVVMAMLAALEDKGVIERASPGNACATRLTPSGCRALSIPCPTKEEVKIAMETARHTANVEAAHEARRQAGAKRVRDAWAYMVNYQRKHGHLPSQRDVARNIGLGTAGAVTKLAHRMVDRGLFEMGARGYRDGRLLKADLPPPEPRQTIIVKQDAKKEEGGMRKKRNCTRHITHNFEERARILAKIMADHFERYKGWPRFGLVNKAAGYSGASGASYDLREMANRGWAIQHGSRYDPWILTDAGRLALLDDEKADDTPPDVPTPETRREALASMTRDDEPQYQHDEWLREAQAKVARLEAENHDLKRRLAEAITAAPGHKLTHADMVIELIDAGYSVRRA